MRVLRLGSMGTDVMEIQSLLKRMGLYTGTVDGKFGVITKSAVAAFQKRFGLIPDGVVGTNTSRIMEPFILGYDFYTIQPGDTFYSIAKRYGVDIKRIRTANADITDENSLYAGQRVKVPFGIGVIPTDINYTYAVLQRNVAALQALYPFIETGSAGKSVLGRNIYYLKLGKGANKVLYNAAHHALEWITSPLLMKFAEDFARSFALGQTIAGFSPSEIWGKSSIYLIPMVNPDGVELVLNGLCDSNPYYGELIRWNNGSMDFSMTWQANNHGVDLNHNYDAGWEESKAGEAALGISGPGPTRYSGPYPLSEPETRAVVDMTFGIDPRLVLAYHSQGEVVFWNFRGMGTEESKIIGAALADAAGYMLEEASGIASYAGYKDWFIKEYRRPGYTVEVGKGKNPLPISQFAKIYDDNLPLLLLASVI